MTRPRRPRRPRQRVPAPWVRFRLPSGRGAVEQPNVAGDGPVPLTAGFWAALVLTGVAAGLCGAGLIFVLRTVQHAAFGYHTGYFESAVVRADPLRRVAVLLIAGALAGPAWYLLRKATSGEHTEVDDAVWRSGSRLSPRRAIGTSLLSEFVIGAGASLGREAAPKLLGGVSGSVLGERCGFSREQSRMLIACGAGAGLAAVYNVPLGGAAFTAEIMLGVIALPTVLPALACSAVATAVARVYLPDQPTYLDIPDYPDSASLAVWSLPAGLVIGLFAAGFVRLIGWTGFLTVKGRPAIVAPAVAFGLLGLVGIAYPQLLGNGKDMAHDAFVGASGLGLLFALALLKPLVTALCLGSGAYGGLFTPVLSTGAVLGGALGLVWSHVWSGPPSGAFALIGAAAMLGACLQAPVSALVLTIELTDTGFPLMLPMIAATVIATTLARRIDGYSIYSARLPADDWPTAGASAAPASPPASAPAESAL